MEQELALSARRMVLEISERVFPNMGIIEPDLSFFNAAKGLPDLGVAFADGLYLRSLKNQTRLKSLTDKVVVVRLRIADFPLVILGLFFSAHDENFPLLGNEEGTRHKTAGTIRGRGVKLPALLHRVGR